MKIKPKVVAFWCAPLCMGGVVYAMSFADFFLMALVGVSGVLLALYGEPS